MASKREIKPCGRLYLVPVPVGNLGDITLRALEVLKSVELIAAEDTRNARFLLQRYDIPVPRLISFHKFNERSREDILLRHLETGKDLAVISDAGTPGLSDPAQELVAQAVANSIVVIALPGASALLPALTGSGLNSGAFLFLGFLPAKRKLRDAALDRIASSFCPVVLYEAPHRVEALLNELHRLCGARRACLARELTKLHEEFIRGDLQTLSQPGAFNPKGEFVIIIDAAETAADAPVTEPEKLALALLEENVETQSAIRLLGRISGLKRNQAYQLLLRLRGASREE